MKVKIQGYVVRNNEGGYLTHDLVWYHFEEDELDPWVFSREEMLKVLERSKQEGWEVKPQCVVLAEHDTETQKTMITGEEISVEGVWNISETHNEGAGRSPEQLTR